MSQSHVLLNISKRYCATLGNRVTFSVRIYVVKFLMRASDSIFFIYMQFARRIGHIIG